MTSSEQAFFFLTGGSVQRQPDSPSAAGFNAAIQGLSEGFSNLVRQHVELARHEAKDELKQVATQVIGLVVFGAIALVGYLLLLAAIVLLALWLGGVGPMFIACAILAGLHLAVSGVAIARLSSQLSESGVSLPQISEELERNKQWIKQLRKSSSPQLPAEPS
ncbi:phage holin family protein [Lujinxingia vulgaris]|uniref:Phage holin family protein n=1 Tax=Lujinxingia vulgaris TaxID=2600176 RepID=A0A5C6XE08_9DELT|nr:phage holin family protein [Lujinxingia vulgaris]